MEMAYIDDFPSEKNLQISGIFQLAMLNHQMVYYRTIECQAMNVGQRHQQHESNRSLSPRKNGEPTWKTLTEVKKRVYWGTNICPQICL